MRMLLSAHPKAAAEAEAGEGWLPLHLAARYWSSSPAEALQATQMMLHAHPKAAEAKTSSGLLPLHFVALHWGGSQFAEDALHLLLSIFPGATTERSNRGALLIHTFGRNASGTAIVRMAKLTAAGKGPGEQRNEGHAERAHARAKRSPGEEAASGRHFLFAAGRGR